MPDDLSSLLYGDEPSALEKAKAMAATLRRQRAIGELGLLSGDKGLGAYGQSQIANADAGQGFINSLPEKRQGLAEGGLMAELNKLKIAKEQGEAATTARRTAAMTSSASPVSQIRTGLAKSLGMMVPPGSTAEDLTKDELDVGEKAFAAHEVAAHRKSEQAAKPVPEQEAMKVNNQLAALQAIDELEKAHGQVAAYDVLPVGDTPGNAYSDMVKLKTPAIAAGAAPLGRETPELMKHMQEVIPGRLTGHDRARKAFADLRDEIRRNANAQIETISGGGYAPAQIADYKRKLGAALGPSIPAGGGGLSAKAAGLKALHAKHPEYDESSLLAAFGRGER